MMWIKLKILNQTSYAAQNAEEIGDSDQTRKRLRLSAIVNATKFILSPFLSLFFQVVNYGIAGQYEPHLDHAMVNAATTFK